MMPGGLGRVYSARLSGEWCSVESWSIEDMPMLFFQRPTRKLLGVSFFTRRYRLALPFDPEPPQPPHAMP